MTAKRLFNLFFIGTIAALSVRLFFIEDFRIASNSMSPALNEGDLVFVNKFAYNLRLPFSTYEVLKFKRPEKGDIVAFSLPDKGMETFIKRVAAVAGERIEIRSGALYVNDVAVATDAKLDSSNYGPIDIPPNHFFALGDNRADSIDSRNWGPIPYSCLKGSLGFRWFSSHADTETAVKKAEVSK